MFSEDIATLAEVQITVQDRIHVGQATAHNPGALNFKHVSMRESALGVGCEIPKCCQPHHA